MVNLFHTIPENSVFCLRSSNTSGFNLLFCFPIVTQNVCRYPITNDNYDLTKSNILRMPLSTRKFVLCSRRTCKKKIRYYITTTNVILFFFSFSFIIIIISFLFFKLDSLKYVCIFFLHYFELHTL